MQAQDYDLIIIGAGPGGYTAAARAAQCGLRTTLVERERLGGVCLNWGCIPTKALLRSAGLWQELRGARRLGIQIGEAAFDYPAMVRRSRQTVDRLVKGLDLLFERLGVEVISGHGRLEGREGQRLRVVVESGGAAAGTQVLTAAKVILATGGRSRGLPALPFDGERILSSREAIVLTEVPARLLVVGAGAIGLEFADLFATFGARVTVVEMLPHILPAEDEEAAATLRSALAKRGIKIRTGMVVRDAAGTLGDLTCRLVPTGDRDAPAEEIVVDRVLVAVGVSGVVANLGLERLGVTTERGFVTVDEHLHSDAAGVYAIGDLTGPPLLAHAAAAQGAYAAEHAAGVTTAAYDGRWMPAAVFTHPQVASVGMREQEAVAAGLAIEVGRFPFSASGKAVAEGDVTGFVKVILAAETGRLLGAHIVGGAAAELIAELTLAARAGMPALALLQTVHAHPTLSEALPEACAAALGRAIHG